MKKSPRRTILTIIVVLVALFVLIQLVPIGRNHVNPSASTEPAWDSPRTSELVHTACYDCHSNQTTWPWYSNIAPASWLVYNDVREARDAFNFNEMTPEQGKAMVGNMVRKINENEMPPFQYLIIHTNARFSTQEKQDLVAGLQNTFK